MSTWSSMASCRPLPRLSRTTTPRAAPLSTTRVGLRNNGYTLRTVSLRSTFLGANPASGAGPSTPSRTSRTSSSASSVLRGPTRLVATGPLPWRPLCLRHRSVSCMPLPYPLPLPPPALPADVVTRSEWASALAAQAAQTAEVLSVLRAYGAIGIPGAPPVAVADGQGGSRRQHRGTSGPAPVGASVFHAPRVRITALCATPTTAPRARNTALRATPGQAPALHASLGTPLLLVPTRTPGTTTTRLPMLRRPLGIAGVAPHSSRRLRRIRRGQRRRASR